MASTSTAECSVNAMERDLESDEESFLDSAGEECAVQDSSDEEGDLEARG